MAEVYYYISHFNDETCPHLPTLEAAAWFLQHGTMGPDDRIVNAIYAKDLPLAKPGDIIELDALAMLPDMRAFREEATFSAWRWQPAIPSFANFVALRSGPGQGWDFETIGCPTSEDSFRYWLDEIAGDELLVENIAVGVTGKPRGVFFLNEGVPTLILIDQVIEGPDPATLYGTLIIENNGYG